MRLSRQRDHEKTCAWLTGMALFTSVMCACSAHEAQPCTHVRESYQRTAIGIPGVDLLLVVDNTSTMSEEQAALVDALPSFLRVLASGDFDQDGDTSGPEDFRPPSDIRVGVITTDMGSAGHVLPTCARADFGDDGVLRTQGRADVEGCSATYPDFLSFQPGGVATPDAFARDVACVANIGTFGCGIEQPLEAMLKALTPTVAQGWTSPDFVAPGQPGAREGLERPFFQGTSPHGNGANDGFMRPDSVVVIVPLGDEDDCSFHDPELFAPRGPYRRTDLGLRCFAHPEALHPIERYVNGLLQLRVSPQRLVFAPIHGVPIDLAPTGGAPPDWDRLASPDCETPVRDPRLCERLETLPTQIAPSCEAADRGAALPPTRMLQVARELDARGAHVTVQSICEASYEGALREVVRLVRIALGSDCLPHPLPLEPDGSVACELRALMPLGVECDDEGYSPVLDERGVEIREEDRALCLVRQLVPPSREPGAAPPAGSGWFLDDFTVEWERTCGAHRLGPPRLAFAGARPRWDAPVRLECSRSIQDILPGYGSACDPSAAGACGAASDEAPLVCDPVYDTCRVPCESDAQCRRAGLTDFVCDGPWRASVPRADRETSGFCASATCD